MAWLSWNSTLLATIPSIWRSVKWNLRNSNEENGVMIRWRWPKRFSLTSRINFWIKSLFRNAEERTGEQQQKKEIKIRETTQSCFFSLLARISSRSNNCFQRLVEFVSSFHFILFLDPNWVGWPVATSSNSIINNYNHLTLWKTSKGICLSGRLLCWMQGITDDTLSPWAANLYTFSIYCLNGKKSIAYTYSVSGMRQFDKEFLNWTNERFSSSSLPSNKSKKNTYDVHKMPHQQEDATI